MSSSTQPSRSIPWIELAGVMSDSFSLKLLNRVVFINWCDVEWPNLCISCERRRRPGFRSLSPAFGSLFPPWMTQPRPHPGQPCGSTRHDLPLKFSLALTVRRGFYLFKLIFLRVVFCHGSREEREADEVRTSSFFILPSSLGDGVSICG